MPAMVSGEGLPTIPVFITDALADRMGLVEGARVTLQFTGTGREIAVHVVGTEPLLPGTQGSWGVVADLVQVNDQLLRTTSSIPRPGQLWLATDQPDDVAADASALLGQDATVTTVRSGSGDTLLRAAVTGLWIGAAGALALAAAAVAAVVSSLAGSRLGEVAVLRVLGLSSRQQASGRRRELFLVTAFAAALGIAGGFLVSALLIPDLARSAVLDAPPILPAPLQLAVLPWTALLLGFAAIVAAIGMSYGLRVQSQARSASPREDFL
jgi:hypothetical protein